MRVWAFKNFTGHYPIGTSAVVVASDFDTACRMLDRALQEIKLPLLEGQESIEHIQICGAGAHAFPVVHILQDGEY